MTGLGPLLVLTDRSQSPRPLTQTVRSALAGGAHTVVLREKDLPAEERLRLADAVAALVDAVGGVLVIAGTSMTSAAGRPRLLHLAAAAALPQPTPARFGRSCHSADEVAAAVAEGCSYVSVSPVFASESKPGYGPALGLDGLTRLVGVAAATPVYALAGVTVEGAADCVRAGAAGVAVMGAVMRDPHPDRLVERYLTRLQEVSA